MSLISLPFDILLMVFRDLDVVDVIRIGMTCKDLYQTTQDRYVWIDQLDRLRREDPVVKPATPPLISLSVEELKTFVIGRTKFRFRWDKDPINRGFAAKGVAGIPGVHCLTLLPGGKSLLTINKSEGLTLRRIELDGGRASLPVVKCIEYDQCSEFGPVQDNLLTTTLPHPILVRSRGNEVQIFRIDHRNGEMSMETSFPLPDKSISINADGQGRIVGVHVRRSFRPPQAIVIHLDHPGVILEFKISPPYSFLANICVPTESLVIIYHTDNILAFKIPDFSGLYPGVYPMAVTPMGVWPGPRSSGVPVTYTVSETIYNPLSAQEVGLYYVHRGSPTRVITVTIPLNIGNDEPPILKQNSTTLPQCIEGLDLLSAQKGLYIEKAPESDGVYYLVMPLKYLASQHPRRFLPIFVSREEFNQVSHVDLAMDEATGRVIVWGWDEEAQETKIFVGDLV